MRTHLLSDLQGSLAQRLRLLVLASLPVQDGQVVEGGSNLPGAQASFHQLTTSTGAHACERASASAPALAGRDMREQEVISTSRHFKSNSSIKYVDGRNEKKLEATSHL